VTDREKRSGVAQEPYEATREPATVARAWPRVVVQVRFAFMIGA